MARGRYTAVTASISSNTDTTVVTPAAGESVYILYVGVDPTAAGTTSTLQVKDGSTPLMTFATTAIGHQESNPMLAFRDYPGMKLTEGAALVLTTAGGAAATLRVTIIYEVK